MPPDPAPRLTHLPGSGGAFLGVADAASQAVASLRRIAVAVAIVLALVQLGTLLIVVDQRARRQESEAARREQVQALEKRLADLDARADLTDAYVNALRLDLARRGETVPSPPPSAAKGD